MRLLSGSALPDAGYLEVGHNGHQQLAESSSSSALRTAQHLTLLTTGQL